MNKQNQHSNSHGKFLFAYISLAAGLVLAAFLVLYNFGILGFSGEYAKSKEIYSNMQTIAQIAKPSASATKSAGQAINLKQNAPQNPADNPKELQDIKIDFHALQKINPDIVAWINISGTDINYPIVSGKDNEFYLTHSADLSKNKAGAIFADTANKSDFSDQNTILYGHNMKDGSMFAPLHSYTSPEFFLNHPEINIYTPAGDSKYSIFSIYTTDPFSDAYTTNFQNDADFLEYINTTQKKSVLPIATQASGKTITLSTCLSDNPNDRYVVVAHKTK